LITFCDFQPWYGKLTKVVVSRFNRFSGKAKEKLGIPASKQNKTVDS